MAPLVESVVLFDTRDQLFTTGVHGRREEFAANKAQPLNVQAKEGLTLGLAITVRYRLDPKHLDYIEANLPQPVEKEIVPPVVASAGVNWCPTTRCATFSPPSAKKCADSASDVITQKLAADGIVVKEVMLRDIQLPPEYAKGLETCC